jgi:hypothetical protein
LIFKFKFLNGVYDTCQVLISLTWTEVLFPYMPISEVPLMIESEAEVEKNKVVKPRGNKVFNPFKYLKVKVS